VGHVPKGTSGRNTRQQEASELNTTGMYSIVRHPLYLGNLVMWLGVSMFCLNWWLTAIFLLSFWVYYERIMFAEEKFLREKFGDVFVEWANGTPAFLPAFRGWRRSPLPFSMRSALRKEYSGFFALVVCFFGLETWEHAVVEHRLFFAPHWLIIFLVGLLIYLTLRTMKKATTLLDVAGR